MPGANRLRLEESVDDATTLRRITSVEITIELNDSEAEMLRVMTANRNSVSHRMGCTSGVSMAEMAAFVLRDELPEKAEFWRQQAELRTQMERAAK